MSIHLKSISLIIPICLINSTVLFNTVGYWTKKKIKCFFNCISKMFFEQTRKSKNRLSKNVKDHFVSNFSAYNILFMIIIIMSIFNPYNVVFMGGIRKD